MGLNKIQQKAQVFKIIERLRNKSAVDKSIVLKTLDELKDLENADFDFISRLLIKEADPKSPKNATGFIFIAEKLSPESFLEMMLNELNSNRVDDEKKMFLINILSGIGVRFKPEEIGAYLSNPDDAINSETTRFLESAKIDPEARIDFLDFYFSSAKADRKDLLNTVSEDFEGDKLVNILSPLALTVDEMDTVMYCIDVMEETKSLLGVKPLSFLSHSTNEKVSSRAKKILQKMRFQGVFDDKKLNKFYKDLLEDFEEPVVRISMPDGNSNFSLVVSRKTKDDAYFVLFVALNIFLGPFSCFGFSSITKDDHDTVINRFFTNSEQIFISPSAARKILDTLAIKRIELNKVIPYEYFCWDRLLDDVEVDDKELALVLNNGLSYVKINDGELKLLINSPFVQNWFYRYSKNNPVYSEIIDKILKLNEENISEIENLINAGKEEFWIKDNIKYRTLYLAFCLKQMGADDLADLYFSLPLDENKFNEFVLHILKRSIYEHFLNLRMPTPVSKNIFRKFEPKKKDDVSLHIDYIEKNWVED